MIPFTDADTRFALVRGHLDDLVREAEQHRLARRTSSERPRRPGRWPSLRRAARPERQPLVP